MSARPVYVDASFFLGMHDADERKRQRSLAFFASHFNASPRMNFEQIGICDAFIWRESREIQDLYYPFMDRLHTDMAIDRGGYAYDEIHATLSRPELKGLRPEQALLVGQVLWNDGELASHDPALLELAPLRGQLWEARSGEPQASFPDELRALYDTSRAFVHHGSG